MEDSSGQVDVAIVGAGPAGVLLAHMLVRAGLSVVLLEACHDFDRDFRGDALTPSVLRVFDRLGLMDRVLEIPHSKLSKIELETSEGPATVTDYGVLPAPYNYVLVVPQPRLLELLVEESRGYAGFQIHMGARLNELLIHCGRVIGLGYRQGDRNFQVHCQLVIGADGRHSKTRELIEEKPIRNAPPMDVLWFRLARLGSDSVSRNLSVSYGRGFYVALTDRGDHWTAAYVMRKGSYRDLRQQGIEAFRQSVAGLLPEFEDRLGGLQWSQIFYLAPDSSRCHTWHREGLLLIGDAAHVMSSVGGLGIQTAIQDAVVAANELVEPLRRRRVTRQHLRWIQWRRWPIVWALQWVQRMGQNGVIARILNPDQPFRVPFYLKSRFMQCFTAWVVGYGLKLELPELSWQAGTWSNHQLGQR